MCSSDLLYSAASTIREGGRQSDRYVTSFGIRTIEFSTAKGFVFLSVEDETGVFNVILDPKTFDRFKFVVLSEPFLLIDGVLQNVDDVVSVKAARVAGLPEGAAAEVHNFR